MDQHLSIEETGIQGLYVVNPASYKSDEDLAGFLHFLWNDIATLQEMGYEVSVAMNENSAAGPNLIEIPKLEEMGIGKEEVKGILHKLADFAKSLFE